MLLSSFGSVLYKIHSPIFVGRIRFIPAELRFLSRCMTLASSCTEMSVETGNPFRSIVFYALGDIFFADSELLRREAGANRAYRHRMAVRDGKIAAPFYSMAERVTEIEFLTLSEVKLIA